MFRVIGAGKAFPMLQHLAETEVGTAQSLGGVTIQRDRKGQHDWFLAFIAQARLGGENPATGAAHLPDLCVVCCVIAQ